MTVNRKTFLTATLFLISISCSHKKETPKTAQQKPNTADTNTLSKQAVQSPPEVSPNGKPVPVAKSMIEMLQGKWQHSEDKSNYLVFENNHRKEIAGGMEKWDDELFVLSNKCMNQTDKARDIETEKDHYISCSGSDLCWYISDIDEHHLTLSYMGRGNTLSYNRVK